MHVSTANQSIDRSIDIDRYQSIDRSDRSIDRSIDQSINYVIVRLKVDQLQTLSAALMAYRLNHLKMLMLEHLEE